MAHAQDTRFAHLGRKLAIFAAFALGLVVLAVVMIGRERDLFTKKYELRFSVAKGTGFTAGMPVKLSGFRIGRVKSLALNEQAAVDIILQIDRQYQKWIKRDSRVKLVKEGLVGETVVEVSVGSTNQPVLQENEVLAWTPTKSFEEVADELAEKVKPVLIEVRDIIGYINDPKGDVKSSLHNIRLLSGNLEETRLQAGRFITTTGNDVHLTAGKAAGAIEASTRALQSAERSLTIIEQRLPQLLEKTDCSLTNIEQLSSQAEQAASGILPRVPVLLDKGEQAADDAGQVIDSVKRIWPLSAVVSQPGAAPLLRSDSHE
ncbi:MAG TPA: MCE family protein [Desulfuromonadales bacterium]|nr:MCE family protein [Desulfuromonadales bacterium]